MLRRRNRGPCAHDNFKYIVAGDNGAQHLIFVLGRASYQDSTDIIFGIIQLWLEYVSARESLDSAFEPTSGFLSLMLEYSRSINPTASSISFYGIQVCSYLLPIRHWTWRYITIVNS